MQESPNKSPLKRIAKLFQDFEDAYHTNAAIFHKMFEDLQSHLKYSRPYCGLTPIECAELVIQLNDFIKANNIVIPPSANLGNEIRNRITSAVGTNGKYIN